MRTDLQTTLTPARDTSWMGSPETLQGDDEVVRFIVDAADRAFSPILSVDALAQILCVAPYVLGYGVTRLCALTVRACAEQRRLTRIKPPMEEAARKFLKGDYRSVCHAMDTMDGISQERYRQGSGYAHVRGEYLFGQRDVRKHPRFCEAAAYERTRSKQMPRRRHSGSSEAIAHDLERLARRSHLVAHHEARMAAFASRPAAPSVQS